MTWKERFLSVSLQAIFLLFNIGTVFGLTTFYYSEKHKSFVDSKSLTRYCKFMALGFFVLYPTAIILLFGELTEMMTETGITAVARRFVYFNNWLLGTIILLNQSSYSVESCRLYNRAGASF